LLIEKSMNFSLVVCRQLLKIVIEDAVWFLFLGFEFLIFKTLLEVIHFVILLFVIKEFQNQTIRTTNRSLTHL